MHTDELCQVFVNFSKRSINLLDNEGYEKTVNWKWDSEGAEGFAETVSALHNVLDHNMITYQCAVK
jgi:hypothetical protein